MAWVANESEPTVSWGSLWLLGTVLLSAWALSWSGGFYDRPALLAYGLISVGLLVSARQAVTPKRPPIDRVSWNAVLHVAFLAQALLVVVTRIPLLGLGAWGRPLLLDVTNPALSRWVTALSYVVIALVLAQHPHLVRRLPRRVVSGMRAGTVACVCVRDIPAGATHIGLPPGRRVRVSAGIGAGADQRRQPVPGRVHESVRRQYALLPGRRSPLLSVSTRIPPRRAHESRHR